VLVVAAMQELLMAVTEMQEPQILVAVVAAAHLTLLMLQLVAQVVLV
jgi:hypothetical protein